MIASENGIQVNILEQTDFFTVFNLDENAFFSFINLWYAELNGWNENKV